MTRAKLAEFESRWRERNKFLKSMGLPLDTFEQFLDYVHGKKIKGPKPVAALLREKPYQRETPYIPSLPTDTKDMQNATALKAPNIYSGSRKLLGIVTMHKSNMVPVFADNKEVAIEIAQMRR